MQCIKTGCQIFLAEYNAWAYGDAFELETDEASVYVFRLCDVRYRGAYAERPLHFTVHKIDQWFDKDLTSMNRTSTLISHTVTNHDYDGVPA